MSMYILSSTRVYVPQCPGGTYNNRTGRSSVSQCLEVPVGFWAPLGSALPEECPPSGFYCPGAAADTLFGGSKPIIIPVGESTMEEELSVIKIEMALSMTMEDYEDQEAAMKAELADVYDVPAGLISLSAEGGSIVVTSRASLAGFLREYKPTPKRPLLHHGTAGGLDQLQRP